MNSKFRKEVYTRIYKSDCSVAGRPQSYESIAVTRTRLLQHYIPLSYTSMKRTNRMLLLESPANPTLRDTS